MNDQQLDHLIEQAMGHYRPPPAVALDHAWAAVERRRRSRPAPRPWAWMTGIAAGLLLSFTLGRLTATSSDPGRLSAPAPVAGADQPIDAATGTLLGETAVLLMSLPASRGSDEGRFAAQAHDLLVTTRLLMDSRAAANPRLRDLLQDLELTLAQIARLQNAPTRDELKLIADAVEQHDIVPRIRSLAAGLPAGDN